MLDEPGAVSTLRIYFNSMKTKFCNLLNFEGHVRKCSSEPEFRIGVLKT